MKALLKLFVFVSVIVLIAIGCQKVLTNENSSDIASDKEFNTAGLKNWYFSTFEKTTEWKNTWSKGKFFPDWKNGNYHKIATMEILEFPLLQQHTKLLIPDNDLLESNEIKKLVNASLKRIVFIKNAQNEISVRAIDYIPEWQYLQEKGFDISKVAYGKQGDDFTGTMIVKKLDGTIVSMQLLKNGRILKKATQKASKNNVQNKGGPVVSSLTCTTQMLCMWYEDCDVYGDGFTNNCGEPYMDPDDCIFETYCSGDDDPCGTYGCEGGGGVNNNISITNLLSNECLKQLFNQLKDGALKDLLIAYTGSQHNLTVSNGSSVLSPNQPGQTGPNNNNNNIDMLLNESLLIGSTYEAATETMLHESIHAYFMGLSTSDMNDHANMLCNYAIGMIEKLQSLYPSLNYFDAASLVFSGFQPDNRYTTQQLAVFNNSKNEFLNLIVIHEANGPFAGLVTPTNLNNTATGYHNGNFGTKFPAGGCP